MNQNIVELTDRKCEARTLEDPQMRIVCGIQQSPLGPIVCPFCRRATAFDATSVYTVLLKHKDHTGKPFEAMKGMCNVCTGYLLILRQGEHLRIFPGPRG